MKRVTRSSSKSDDNHTFHVMETPPRRSTKKSNKNDTVTVSSEDGFEVMSVASSKHKNDNNTEESNRQSPEIV